MEYKLIKGELNRLNKINQELKHIFNYYIISNDGTMMLKNNDQYILSGIHFINLIDFKPFSFMYDFNNYEFSSKDIFDIIKNHKKDINSIFIDNGELYLKSDKDKYKIGNVNSDVSYPLSYIDDSNNMIELSQSDCINLIRNKYVNLSLDKFRVRITKEVIPGLKKSHKIIIFFKEHETDNKLFYLILKVYRDGMITYHKYRCIYI